jgi:hypothetical protein
LYRPNAELQKWGNVFFDGFQNRGKVAPLGIAFHGFAKQAAGLGPIQWDMSAHRWTSFPARLYRLYYTISAMVRQLAPTGV